MAPEVILGNMYTTSCDWWSFGVIVFCLLYDKYPFGNTVGDQAHVILSRLRTKLTFPDSEKEISREAQDFLSRLLERHPGDRLRDAANVKGHDWFRDTNFYHIRRKKMRLPFRFEPVTTSPYEPRQPGSPASMELSQAMFEDF